MAAGHFQTQINPGLFEPANHWYEKALNAQVHPLIHFFINLSSERIISRYCHLHPLTDKESLRVLLAYQPTYFAWSGSDLLHVTSANGKRQMVVVETNSCPSGQKSMPLVDEAAEQGGYRSLIEQTLKPRLLAKRNLPDGALAVLYDKNQMEASGYAAVMADVFEEPVHLVYFDGTNKAVRWSDRLLEIQNQRGDWIPIRAAFRYVTQQPWAKIPIKTKTYIFNPIIACLAGGRNKMVAAKAYDFFNGEMADSQLKILTPEPIWDVSKTEIPLWVNRLGGQAVVKVPYSNAGQGVYTIVNQEELDQFMKQSFFYDRFIVQSLIGNYQWSSTGAAGKFYHVGTVPSLKGKSYAADLRMMIQSTKSGFRPMSMYARRAAKPLVDNLSKGDDSWSILGTNLSFKKEDGGWGSDTGRLMLVDRRDFNKLGIGLDDLIDGFIQSVMATVAIDKMAKNLVNAKGTLKSRLFKSLNDDPALIQEIL